MSPDPNDDPFKNRAGADRDHITREKNAATTSLTRAKAVEKAKSKPAFVKTREVFESHPDPALNAGIRAIVPELINGALTSWTSLTDGLDQIFADAHKRNLAVTEFQGKAANASMAGSDKYAKMGVQFAADSAEVKNRIEAVYHAASAVKMAAREIPPKPVRPDGGGYGSITDILGNGPKEAAYSEAKTQTLYAVNSILKPGFWPAGDAVPSYTTPPQLVDPGAGGTDPGRITFSGNQPSAGQPGGPVGARPNPEDTVNAAYNNPQVDPAGIGANPGGNPHNPQANNPQNQLPPATNPANTPTALAPGAPGYPGGPRNPDGTYSPGRGPNDRRDDSGNNAGLVAGAPIGRGGAGVMPTTAGMPHGPGMPGVPRPARKDDEQEREKKTPAHLITAINGSELLGPPIKATPPVIGDWDYTNDRPIDRTPQPGNENESSAPQTSASGQK